MPCDIWHPCIDCLNPLVRDLDKLIDAGQPVITDLLTQMSQPSHRLAGSYSDAKITDCEQWLEFQHSPDYAHGFGERLRGFAQNLRAWETKAIDKIGWIDEPENHTGLSRELYEEYDDVLDDASWLSQYLAHLSRMLNAKIKQESSPRLKQAEAARITGINKGVISRAVKNKQIEAYADGSIDQQSVLKFAESRRKRQELKQRADKAAEAEADEEVRQKMREVGLSDGDARN